MKNENCDFTFFLPAGRQARSAGLLFLVIARRGSVLLSLRGAVATKQSDEVIASPDVHRGEAISEINQITVNRKSNFAKANV
ncbi:MAG: hypothetical protein Q8M92_10690 [Candidatus Subteraquimicrobiales bacterium]|nr:hypothetical protein [Candidatus Subteraquimicrobiales bacterium]